MAIVEELGDRAGMATASGNLGSCHRNKGEYDKAVALYKTQYEIATELQLAHVCAEAALGIGLALRQQLRADRLASEAREGSNEDLGEGPDIEMHSELNDARGKDSSEEEILSSAKKSVLCQRLSPLLKERVDEAARWLNIAYISGQRSAALHLARLAYDADEEDTALQYLKDYLGWRIARGRNWCEGCQQKRGEDAPMLSCGGCHVARFCNVEHQKMASKSASCGGNMWTGRHKDICGILGQWRRVEKDGVSPDSWHADLLTFLRLDL